MKEVVEVLVKALVDHPDEVEIIESPGDAPGVIRLDVHVAPDDAGKVIGRHGKIANALRAVAKASGQRVNQRVFLDIVT
jgi:uncharacterized protein